MNSFDVLSKVSGIPENEVMCIYETVKANQLKLSKMNKKMVDFGNYRDRFPTEIKETLNELASEFDEAAEYIRLLETLLDIFVDARDMNEESDGEIWINTWKALASRQKDISPEFVKIVEENFWELLA